jgi:hypothetical protein
VATTATVAASDGPQEGPNKSAVNAASMARQLAEAAEHAAATAALQQGVAPMAGILCAAISKAQHPEGRADVCVDLRVPGKAAGRVRKHQTERMREVEELLASVGEGGCKQRSIPLVLGPKPAAPLVDTAILESIREELDAAAAAAKQAYGCGGVCGAGRVLNPEPACSVR